MNTITTEGVKISVITKFRPDLSQVNENQFFFNYRIEMENSNESTVQLMHRSWYIFDSLDRVHLVDGEGVIGEQPILKQDQKYYYTSGCQLSSEIGYMKGSYTFRNQLTGDMFEVLIPTFQLIYPGKMN
jgi:ApaG protein